MDKSYNHEVPPLSSNAVPSPKKPAAYPEPVIPFFKSKVERVVTAPSHTSYPVPTSMLCHVMSCCVMLYLSYLPSSPRYCTYPVYPHTIPIAKILPRDLTLPKFNMTLRPVTFSARNSVDHYLLIVTFHMYIYDPGHQRG